LNNRLMKIFVIRKLIKPAAFLVLQILTVTNLHCQVQENMIDFLTRKFEDYIHAVPWEEIYIHTDREEYIAGEDLWFNVYLIDRQSLKPSSQSRIAYFELLNSENRPIVQKRIFINKGFGPGQLQLPDTLSPGTYTIRAYTNWMKNFLPDNCFYKDIKVFNALNRVRFRQKLIPAESEKKEISVSDNQLNERPGINLKAEYIRSSGLNIDITADEKFITKNNSLIYLFIQTHGRIDHVSARRIEGNSTSITLPESSLTKGIAHITVFDSKGQPVREKYIFIPVVERQIASVSCIDSCGPREKITVSLESISAIDSTLIDGNISISVSPLTKDKHSTDMNDYLILGTEFGQNTVNKSLKEIINDPNNEVIDSILENTRSKWINWGKILSDEIPVFKYQIEKEDHILQGKLIADQQSSSSSSEHVLLCIPGRKAEFQYAVTDNEGNFKFSIPVDDRYRDLIIMPDYFTRNERLIIESAFSDRYFKDEIPVNSLLKQIPQYIEEWSVNYQVNRIYSISSSGNSVKQIFSPIEPIRFYGKPDVELILSDYVSLPEMEEVFFELLPHVTLKKKNSNYEILITDRMDDKRVELTPVLLLDGVIINDPAIIADLDPLTVEKIEVVREKYIAGIYFFSGIVNVITKAADFSSVQLPDYMIRLPYRTIDPVMSFVSPDYSAEEEKDNAIPDFRNTLYWNPSLKPDKEGRVVAEFWTSDVVSDYEIVVRGINKEGEIITARKFFRVK